MGVHGLWQLLHPSGRPVTLESLEGKVLAVDVSIWLHQSMKGMRDKDGNALPSAHLQGLFSRVCKLLFYRIKPVFVFDGGIPDLKKQTLAARRERKSEAQRERDEIGRKLLQNLIKSQAVKEALGRGGSSGGPPVRVPGVRRKGGESDLFELAPLPEAQEVGLALNSEAWDADFEQQENWIREGLATLSKVDPDSNEFKSLPMEIQHEALVDLKEERKFHSLSRIGKMPEDADSFSNYQLKKLMKVSNLTTRIDEVRKEMSNKVTADIRYEMGDDYYGDEVEGGRIVSEDASHYILIKGLTKEKQMEEAERYELDRKIKVEKEEEDNRMMEVEEERDKERTDRGHFIKDNKVASSSVPAKRPIQGHDNQGAQKKTKYYRKKDRRNISNNLRKGAVLSSVMHDDDDDDDDDVEMNDDNKVEEIEDTDSSSSEDEGFIEVTFDPNQTVEEDDLFPASIFSTAATNDTATTATHEPKTNSRKQTKTLSNSKSTPLSSFKGENAASELPAIKVESDDDVDLISLSGIHKNKKDLIVKSQVKQSPASIKADGTSGENVDLTEKRKNVLNDILAEIQRKKETLLDSVSVDDDDMCLKEGDGKDGDVVDVDSRDGGDGNGIEMEDAGDELPGGFIREDSDSDDETGDVKRDKTYGSKKDIHGMTGIGWGIDKSRVFESDDEDDDDSGDNDGAMMMMSQHGGRMNESEDEDLKLAIELSLQTARQRKSEKNEGELKSFDKGKNSESNESVDRERFGESSVANDDEEDDEFKRAIELSIQTAKQDMSIDKPKTGGKFYFHKDKNVDNALPVSDKDGVGNERVEFNDDKFDDDDDDEGDFETVETTEFKGLTKQLENSEKLAISGSHSDKGIVVADVVDNENGNIVRDAIGVDCGLKMSDSVSPSKMSSQERLQPEDVEDPFTIFQQNNLQNIREELNSERTELLTEQGRQDRFATSLTDQIVLEAQELLNIFGIPYVVSPMEAEAQCAFLDATKQTQGTITDDSDIWLFGGTRVYKNFFNHNKFVEFFSVDSIKSHFGLSREQLIKIALLCGSDYTVGIQGVGPVRALEILGEFQGEGLTGLMAFRKWWDKNHKRTVLPGENKLRSRLKDLSLERGFPSERVMEAYSCPVVDESRERFTWGQPDLDHLRQFAKMKFGWSREKSDSILDPMMKQFLKNQSQGRIHSYFQPGNYVPSSTATAHSDRIKKALSVMQSQKSSTSPSVAESIHPDVKTKSPLRKQRNERGSDNGGGSDDDDGGGGSGVSKTAVKNSRKKTIKTVQKDDGKGDKPRSGDVVVGNEVGLGKKSTRVLKRKGKLNEKNERKEKKIEVEKMTCGDIDDEEKMRCEDDDDVEGMKMSVGKPIKMERDDDDDDKDNGGDFMKRMQERVAMANSLMSNSNAGKKGGGRGRGIGGSGESGGGICARKVGRGRGQAKSGKRKTASVVPSLEKSGVRGRGQGGRGQRGRSSTSRKVALERGVVCLSESSSGSSSSDNDDDDDDEDVVKKSYDEVKDEFNSRIHSYKSDLETDDKIIEQYSKLSSDQRKFANGNKKSNIGIIDQSGQPPYPANSQNQESNEEKVVTKDRITSLGGSTPIRMNVEKKNGHRMSNDSEIVKKEKIEEENIEKGEIKAVLSSRGDVDVKRRKKMARNKETIAVESKTLIEREDRSRKEKSSELKSRNVLSISDLSTLSTYNDQRVTCEDESSREKQVVGQVSGKNPDVSIINALTLKATMAYLNRRSVGEKQLLNALGGKRPANAVERRLEEEERRRRSGSHDQFTSRSHGTVREGVDFDADSKNRKTKVDKSKLLAQKSSAPKLSFEDMLGETEALLTMKFSKSSTTTGMKKSNKTKKDLKSMAGKDGDVKSSGKTDGVSQIDRVGQGNTVKSKSIQDRMTDYDPTVRRVNEDSLQKSKRVQLKSISDESSLDDGLRIETKSCRKSDRKEQIKSGDKGGEAKNKTVNEQSRDKFRLQVSHFSDVQSVKGHGFVPPQNRSTRSQAYDTPIRGDDGKCPPQIKSKKSQAFDSPIGAGDDDNSGVCGVGSGGSGVIPSKGRAVAGKGKGIGKNRNGRRQQQQQDGAFEKSLQGSGINIDCGVRQDQVRSVLASSGVTDAEIREYGCVTMDDLGSDFDEDDF